MNSDTFLISASGYFSMRQMTAGLVSIILTLLMVGALVYMSTATTSIDISPIQREREPLVKRHHDYSTTDTAPGTTLSTSSDESEAMIKQENEDTTPHDSTTGTAPGTTLSTSSDESEARVKQEIPGDPLIISDDSGSLQESTSREQLVKQYFPMVMKHLGNRLLPEYKAPCFKSDRRVRCLPYFYLIGPPKCATTDLWFNIQRHPQIVQALGDEPKEPHWWTLGNKTNIKSISKYLSRQDGLVRKANTLSQKRRLISGDGSASTIFNVKQIGKIMGNPDLIPFSWADVIHAVTPGVKIITILRNPVDRTISDYFAFNKDQEKNKGPQHFHDNLVEVLDVFNNCLQRFSLHRCVYYQPFSYPRIHISVYITHIREWKRVFSDEQLLILKTEDWHNHTQLRILPDIFEFLEIDPLEESQLPDISQQYQLMIESKQASRKAKSTGEILPKSRALLKQFYEPYNKLLADFLEDNRFLEWND